MKQGIFISLLAQVLVFQSAHADNYTCYSTPTQNAVVVTSNNSKEVSIMRPKDQNLSLDAILYANDLGLFGRNLGRDQLEKVINFEEVEDGVTIRKGALKGSAVVAIRGETIVDYKTVKTVRSYVARKADFCGGESCGGNYEVLTGEFNFLGSSTTVLIKANCGAD